LACRFNGVHPNHVMFSCLVRKGGRLMGSGGWAGWDSGVEVVWVLLFWGGYVWDPEGIVNVDCGVTFRVAERVFPGKKLERGNCFCL